MKNQLELLSPAGGMDALVAAVQSGADAVYLGGASFSARAGAKNFDDESLELGINYAHLREVKVFVTLNTLIKHNELERALQFAAKVYNFGADALIVQDMGLASILLKDLPDLPLHASTQMSVHNLDGAKRLHELGFTRVVLARELSAQQISHINKNVPIETEVFVHGALCYSYSGQCLFSSLIGGRSGNRGRCAQPCRLPYSLIDATQRKPKEEYLLSPKDLCLIDKLDELRQCGITSLKIEGRLKPAGYVATVTGIYRKYLDQSASVSKEDMTLLEDAFSRSGFTHGHFAKQTGKALMTYENPTNTGQGIHFKQTQHLWHEEANLRKVKIKAQVSILKDRPVTLQMQDFDGCSVSVESDEVPQIAVNMPLTEERIQVQIEKLGSTPFELSELEINLDEGLMLPASQLNALRRKATDALANARIERHKPKQPITLKLNIDKKSHADYNHLDISVQAYTTEQAKAALQYPIKRLYAPAGILSAIKDIKSSTELVTVLPDVMHDDSNPVRFKRNSLLTGIHGTGYRLSEHHTIFGDFRLNIYNSAAANAFAKEGFSSVCLSPELTLKDIETVTKYTDIPCEMIGYGRLPLMVTKECVIKGCAEGCRKGKLAELKDRTRSIFPVLCGNEACVNIIFNSRPIYLADKLADLKKSGVQLVRLLFTIENATQCDTILNAFFAKTPSEPDELFGTNGFTRGHAYRGVD